ncbi:hypothetical protein H0G86_003098 [Trichoderma simmonsii]|uniref:Uncharacterized protein n=1 Tax=Trichoderma simmonsii TaxID=1491479 RepID=A0A8G0L9Z5_9HYPO|nr:hypothetical protein H0G86_003098 [Trichoderma simmonsii]
MIDAPLTRCSPFQLATDKMKLNKNTLAGDTEHCFSRLVWARQILPLASCMPGFRSVFSPSHPRHTHTHSHAESRILTFHLGLSRKSVVAKGRYRTLYGDTGILEPPRIRGNISRHGFDGTKRALKPPSPV